MTAVLQRVSISRTRELMADAAAQYATSKLQDALKRKKLVRLVAATGASQLDFLSRLTAVKDIDWARIELFHLDEYVGVGPDHPASFARYIKERIIQPTGIQKFHLLDGSKDAKEVIERANAEISSSPVDVAFVGIGENAHLAFNDPPADFETREPYLIVTLDEPCRKQQVGEGWFKSVDEVPKQAISMSVRQIMSAGSIICTVPDERKAKAVQASLRDAVTPDVPASILKTHGDVRFFLDGPSAKLLLEDNPAAS
jgi:glucosamine-6-phosphate deaminase